MAAKTAKRPPGKKTAPAKKKTATKKAAPARKKTAAKKAPMAPRRDDFGAGIETFLAKQSGPILALVNELRSVVEKAAPDAVPALKWGMPMYMIGKAMVCGIGAHKAHVNLILSGPPGTFADPKEMLTGEGKTGRHLKLSPGDNVPSKEVAGWVATAAKLARGK